MAMLFEKRKLRSEIAIEVLDNILKLLTIVDIDLYEQHQSEAEERLRDPLKFSNKKNTITY
jgi:hypothetical protein